MPATTGSVPSSFPLANPNRNTFFPQGGSQTSTPFGTSGLPFGKFPFEGFAGMKQPSFFNNLLQETGFQQNLLGKVLGQSASSFQGFQGAFGQALGAANNLQGNLGGLAGQLQTSALSSTAGASAAATQAARTAAGGRGGLAFGGGAGQIASRAAQGAAVGQSAALTQALAQGEIANQQLQFQRSSAQAQLLSGLSGQQLQANTTQANLAENRIGLQAGGIQNFQQLLNQIALAEKGAVLSSSQGSSNRRNKLYKIV